MAGRHERSILAVFGMRTARQRERCHVSVLWGEPGALLRIDRESEPWRRSVPKRRGPIVSRGSLRSRDGGRGDGGDGLRQHRRSLWRVHSSRRREHNDGRGGFFVRLRRLTQRELAG
jgi:hypothetical protein